MWRLWAIPCLVMMICCHVLVNDVHYALITIGQIGDGTKRKNIYGKLLEFGYKLPTVVSPLAYVARDVELGGWFNCYAWIDY